MPGNRLPSIEQRVGALEAEFAALQAEVADMRTLLDTLGDALEVVRAWFEDQIQRAEAERLAEGPPAPPEEEG